MTHPANAHLPSLWCQTPLDWALCDLLTPVGAFSIARPLEEWLKTDEGKALTAHHEARLNPQGKP